MFASFGFSIQKASRPPQDRTMVVACLAEVAQDMGAPIAGYIDVLADLKLTVCLFGFCNLKLTLAKIISDFDAFGTQRNGIIRCN